VVYDAAAQNLVTDRSHHHDLAPARRVERVSYILDACRGASVVHLGCVDHPLLDDRLATGDLLHAKIHDVADVLFGVDLADAGIARLKDAGYQNLYVGDIQEPLRLPRRFDVVVASEVLEHLPNPGRFLRAVPTLLADDGQLLLTVPSAQSLRVAINAARGKEVVHPDHTAYYSPRTLQTLLEAHGFVVEEMQPYWTAPRPHGALGRAYDRAIRAVGWLSPWLGEGIVVRARSCRHEGA
jgi:2-polyprenyl-3-methyl-5-hydroxy-6-metoxy-1,4-benzoquinol methylase